MNEFTLNSVFLATALVALVLTQLVPRWLLFAPERSNAVLGSIERLLRLALALAILLTLSLGLKFGSEFFAVRVVLSDCSLLNLLWL